MDYKEHFYPEARFGGFSDIDGTVTFFTRVNSLMDSSFVILDVGCGRGAYGEDSIMQRRKLRILRGKAAKLIGIDVDRNAQDNPFLDEFRHIQTDSWPIDTNSVDLIICDNVLEHVEDPKKFFMEIRRVLKNGGFLCIRTPNRWGYVALAATLIPNKYHSHVTSIVQDGRKVEDVFPTLYRCNSIRKLENAMKKSGFRDCVVYGYEAEPSYLSFSKAAYFAGVLYQRFAPNFVRAAIFAFGKLDKSADQHVQSTFHIP